MPGAADGARQHRQRLSSEEVGSQDRGKAGVLHAHLKGDRALLGYIESGQTSGKPTEQVAQRVVAKHDSKGPKEQDETTRHEIVVYR